MSPYVIVCVEINDKPFVLIPQNLVDPVCDILKDYIGCPMTYGVMKTLRTSINCLVRQYTEFTPIYMDE